MRSYKVAQNKTQKYVGVRIGSDANREVKCENQEQYGKKEQKRTRVKKLRPRQSERRCGVICIRKANSRSYPSAKKIISNEQLHKERELVRYASRKEK